MKMQIDKKRLFIEHLEKRVSTSPLLVEVRSVEGFSVIEKLKKFTQPASSEYNARMTVKSNLVNTNDVKLSNDKFVNRIEQKQRHLSKMAFNREELLNRINAPQHQKSSKSFLNRIEKKQEHLVKMAFDKNDLKKILHKS